MQILFNKEKEIEEGKKIWDKKENEKIDPRRKRRKKDFLQKLPYLASFCQLEARGINSANNHLEKYNIYVFREYHFMVGLGKGQIVILTS